MSGVSIRRPVLNLPKLLREPGGLPLVEALALARKNLDAATIGYLTNLAAGVTEIATLTGGAPASFDGPFLLRVYEKSGNLIGIASVCALPSIDDALVSLCDLLDQLRTRELWDAEAVAVHVNALRLLIQNPSLEGQAGATAILDGLHRVSRRYLAEEAAQANTT